MGRTFMLGILVLCAACAQDDGEESVIYDKAAVERRTIEVAVSSAGIVEPLAAVEVKSKASGEVLELHVDSKKRRVLRWMNSMRA